MLRTQVLAATVALSAMATPAHAACIAPAAPYCLNGSGPFATDTEATNCYNEFIAYFEAMKATDTCLNSEIDAFVAQQKSISESAWAAYDRAYTAYNQRIGN